MSKTKTAAVSAEATVAEVTATAPTTEAKAPKATKATKPAAEKKPKATKAEKPVVEKAPKAPSKKSLVLPIVTDALAAKTPRKDTLAKLQADLGISAACANTYYQNVKSGNWK